MERKLSERTTFGMVLDAHKELAGIGKLEFRDLIWIVAAIHVTTRTVDAAMAKLQEMDLSSREAIAANVKWARSDEIGADFTDLFTYLDAHGTHWTMEFLFGRDRKKFVKSRPPGISIVLEEAFDPTGASLALFALDGRSELALGSTAGMADGSTEAWFRAPLKQGAYLLIESDQRDELVEIQFIELDGGKLRRRRFKVRDRRTDLVVFDVIEATEAFDVPNVVLERLRAFSSMVTPA